MQLPDIPVGLGAFGGAFAMLVLLYLGLARGRIWVNSSVQALLEQYKLRVADRDTQIVMWRAVAETSQAQMRELLEAQMNAQRQQGGSS